jgi:EpsI family protein
MQRGELASADAGPRAGRGVDLRTLRGVALCSALAVLAYRPLLWFFVPSSTIAPVVVVLSGWLLYRRWGWLRGLPSRSGAPILAGGLLTAGLASHAWATWTQAADLLVPSLMLNALGLGALWKGAAALRALLVPVAFLIFAMPLPPPLLNELVFHLQIWTTEFTGSLLSLLGVPHLVAGEQILRARQTFSVIEACSGLRSMETLTMVAILMMDLFRRRGAHAVLVLVAAPFVAFALNGFRAVALILNPHSEAAAVHNLQGVAILLVGLVLLFLFDGVLDKLLPTREPAAGGAGAVTAPVTATRRFLPAALAVSTLAAGSALWFPRGDAPPSEPLRLSATLASGIGDLFSKELEVDRLFLGTAGFHERVMRRFERDGVPVDVFLGVGDRSQRDRSPLSPKTALPGSGWVVEDERQVRLVADGPLMSERLLRSGGRRLLVYHWYEHDRGLLREALRSLLAIDSTPWGNAEEIVVVRLETEIVGPIEEQRPRAEARLASFYGELRSILEDLGRSARGKRFS